MSVSSLGKMFQQKFLEIKEHIMEIKDTLRTFEAQKGVKFKNIEPLPKITGSYKK